MTGHILGHEGLLGDDDILEGNKGGKGKAQIRIFRPNNWGYGIRVDIKV